MVAPRARARLPPLLRPPRAVRPPLRPADHCAGVVVAGGGVSIDATTSLGLEEGVGVGDAVASGLWGLWEGERVSGETLGGSGVMRASRSGVMPGEGVARPWTRPMRAGGWLGLRAKVSIGIIQGQGLTSFHLAQQLTRGGPLAVLQDLLPARLVARSAGECLLDVLELRRIATSR